jgi:hypothetical protein
MRNPPGPPERIVPAAQYCHPASTHTLGAMVVAFGVGPLTDGGSQTPMRRSGFSGSTARSAACLPGRECQWPSYGPRWWPGRSPPPLEVIAARFACGRDAFPRAWIRLAPAGVDVRPWARRHWQRRDVAAGFRGARLMLSGFTVLSRRPAWHCWGCGWSSSRGVRGRDEHHEAERAVGDVCGGVADTRYHAAGNRGELIDAGGVAGGPGPGHGAQP